MNHRDFSKVIKNKTVVDTSIDIGNFTFTPYSDGVRIKSKNPSKTVEKGIGYVRTPDNVEIKFTPYAYSIDRDAGSSTTIEIRGELDKVIDPKKSLLTKRMNLPVYNGLNPKPPILDGSFFPESLKKEIAIEFKKTEELLNRKPTEFCELFKEIDAAYDEYIKAERMGNPVIIEKKVKAPHEIEKVIFNPPATIVYWKDGTKTVVKVQEGDVFDPEKGLAMAFFKKMHGNTGNYNNIIHKWIKDYKPKYAYGRICAEPEGLTIKADNLTNPLSDAASELKRIADALEKRDAEKKEPHNELTFGYSEYSMEIDFPKDLDSKELDCMKNDIVREVKLHLEAIRATRKMRKSSDAE